MAARLVPKLAELGSSYWLVPAVMAGAAMGIAFLTLAVDRTMEVSFEIPLLYSGGPSGARVVLQTIAGSMITVAGVVFSITIVALSLASQQYGPLLLRNFMSDRPNQLVLGTFVATFVYCLLVMRAVQGQDGPSEQTFVPELSTTVALVLALASLAVLIFFIHHIARSIRLEGVLSRVAKQLDRSAGRLYPKRIGEEPPDGRSEAEIRKEIVGTPVTVRAHREGYVQTFDEECLLRLAQEKDMVIEICVSPNDFVVRKMAIFRVYPADRCDGTVEDRLARALVMGTDAEIEDDVRHGVQQLVQLALRALSPSLNDPLTAMAAIDRLIGIHARIAQLGVPARYRHDTHGRLRVVAHRSGFEQLLSHAFDPIRANIKIQAEVVVHLLESLAKLAPGLEATERRAVHALVERIGATSRRDLEPEDWPAVERVYRRVLAEVSHASEEGSGVHRAPAARGSDISRTPHARTGG